jgi:hypothetical protein
MRMTCSVIAKPQQRPTFLPARFAIVALNESQVRADFLDNFVNRLRAAFLEVGAEDILRHNIFRDFDTYVVGQDVNAPTGRQSRNEEPLMAEAPLMVQTPSIAPGGPKMVPRRARLTGLYILGAIELLAGLAVLGDAFITGANIGTNYQTPTDRPMALSLWLAGGILFLASLSALFWRVLPWMALVVLQAAAVLVQLPAIREGRLQHAEAMRRGGDWVGLSDLTSDFNLILIVGSMLLAIFLLGYLILPHVRQAFHARRQARSQ